MAARSPARAAPFPLLCASRTHEASGETGWGFSLSLPWDEHRVSYGTHWRASGFRAARGAPGPAPREGLACRVQVPAVHRDPKKYTPRPFPTSGLLGSGEISRPRALGAFPCVASPRCPRPTPHAPRPAPGHGLAGLGVGPRLRCLSARAQAPRDFTEERPRSQSSDAGHSQVPTSSRQVLPLRYN